MKVKAELKNITLEMNNQKLVDCLNENFIELKEKSENRDFQMLNSIERLETSFKVMKADIRIIKSDINVLKNDVSDLKSDVGGLKSDMKLVLDHLSGKKLLTEE